MFRFAYPYCLLLLALVVLAGWSVFGRRVRSGALFAAASDLPRRGWSWRIVLASLMGGVYLAGLTLAIIALARPQTVFSKTTQRADAIAIQMVVDASGSMEALDFSTANARRTRLDVVKETFSKFIEARADDLVGLITFGGYATSRVPLTLDHGAVLLALKGVEVPRQTLDADGNVANKEELMTAIGDALATACARLEEAEVKSKVVVLLSDGESNTGIIKPEEAIKAAKALGLKVYTIGVGSNGRAPFLVRNMFGQEVVVQVQVSMDEELLRRIAQTTAGKYFNVRDAAGMKSALDAIDRLEKTRIQKDVYHQANELFAWFLAPGLSLLALAACLNMNGLKKLI